MQSANYELHMDTKFRKLISRLSLKEKDTNAHRSSGSGNMTVTSCTNNSQQLCEDAAALAEGESMNTVMNCSSSGCNSKDKVSSVL